MIKFIKSFSFFLIFINVNVIGEVDYNFYDLLKIGIPLEILHYHNAIIGFTEEDIKDIILTNKKPKEKKEEPEKPKEEPEKPKEEPEKPKEEPKYNPDVEELLKQARKAYSKKNYQYAEILLDEAERVAPNDARVNTMQGSIHYKLGNIAKARSKWEKSLQINPNQTRVKYFLNKLESNSDL